MQSLNSNTPDLVFGLFCTHHVSGLGALKAQHLWFQLQDGIEAKNQFWIGDVGYPNIFLIEVTIDRSETITQYYLDYWRSFNIPIIWIIEGEISQQSLSHPIYNQLIQNISPAGECILGHDAVSLHSVTSIARTLLNSLHFESQQTKNTLIRYQGQSIQDILSAIDDRMIA